MCVPPPSYYSIFTVHLVNSEHIASLFVDIDNDILLRQPLPTQTKPHYPNLV